jgi:predicted  nucleic acid-binding Zn-ribbon protein
MNEALSALYALQQIDIALAQLERRYHALDPGHAEQAALEKARQEYMQKAEALHQLARDLQDAELELKSVEAKKKEHENKLYGGKITSPKEMVSMQEEIEALGRQRGRLDERILIMMDQLEALRTEVATAETTLKEAEATLSRKQAAYNAETAAITQEVHTLTPRRTKLAATIPPALLKRYETLRATKNGVGISRIEKGICSACHTTLPVKVVQMVQETDSIEICENCGRLLCAEEK